jgi:hypothetical protein
MPSATTGALFVFLLSIVGQGVAEASTHRILLTVSDADLQRYGAAQARTIDWKEGGNERAARARKMVFDPRSATVRVDEGPALPVAELSTHGQTSQDARRRNFELQLADDARARLQVAGLSAAKLFLLSMQADEGYISSAIGFKILALPGLPVPRFSYVELVLNGVSQGLYLAIERPVDAMRRDLNAVYIARRRYFGRLDVKKYEGERTGISEARFTETLSDTLELHDGLGGDDLYTAWSRRIDIDAYMIWLGLNSLLRNGDFSDEVYFYSTSTDPPYYRIFPWDMDDLFKKRMHLAPLNWLLSGFDQSSLLFNFESGLDRKINEDGVLYRRFQDNLRRALTEHVTDEAIYLEIPAVRANARKDWINRKGLDRSSLLELLETRRHELKAMRREFLTRIERG